MTDLDTFAAAALTGLLGADGIHGIGAASAYAKLAYKLADAMVDERARRNREQLGADLAVARMEAQVRRPQRRAGGL